MKIDIHLLKLLSSRLCHDLIGPVGSLNFSLDLIKEDKNFDNQEAIDIAETSVNNLINRLSFFRMAFGATNLGEKEVALHKSKALIIDLFKEKDVPISWNKEVDKTLEKVSNSDNSKVILNIFLMIFYAVQKTAEIKLFAKYLEDNTVGLAISVSGRGLKLGLDNIQSFSSKIDEDNLTPRNIHSYFTHCLAEEIGANIEIIDDNVGEIKIAINLKQ